MTTAASLFPDLARYVAPPLLSALVAVLFVNRVQSAAEASNAARMIRLRLHRALGVGKGLQPYDWTVIKDESFEELAQRLLSLGDEAYGVSSQAGARIHDAAQRLDDAHRLLIFRKEANEEIERVAEKAGSHADELRANVEAFVRYRDMALEVLRMMYTDLADADEKLRRVAPWWLPMFRPRQKVPHPPFRAVSAVLTSALEGWEGSGQAPSSEEREQERVRNLITSAPQFDPPVGEDIPRRRLNLPSDS